MFGSYIYHGVSHVDSKYLVQNTDLMNILAKYQLSNLHQRRVIGLNSLYCGKLEKRLKPYSDHDLDQTIPNVELVAAIFIYCNLFKFHVPESIRFSARLQKQEQTERHTHVHSIRVSDNYNSCTLQKRTYKIPL